VGTVAELDSSIAAGKVGADKILSVLGIFGNNKVGRLLEMKVDRMVRKEMCETRQHEMNIP
jgi:hypothetical protein